MKSDLGQRQFSFCMGFGNEFEGGLITNSTIIQKPLFFREEVKGA